MKEIQAMTRGGGSKAFPSGKCWEVQTVSHDDPGSIATTWRATVEECAEWVRESGRIGDRVTVRGLAWQPFFGWSQVSAPVTLAVSAEWCALAVID